VIWLALTGAGSFLLVARVANLVGTLLLYLIVVLGFTVGLASRYGMAISGPGSRGLRGDPYWSWKQVT